MTSASEYLVGPTIGQGAFAHVVYAKHKKSQKQVAIKVVDQLTLKRRPEAMQMVLTERKVLRQLESSHTVNLCASFYDSQCVYLVMELAAGGDLQDLIHHGLSMKSEKTWLSSVPFYCQQIVRAVQYIHSKRIIHCDLKPQNILCDGHGRLKLADFASAMAMDMIHATVVPRGTCEYCCPELLRAQSDLTPAVDYWSLGCTFHAMLHLESPFHAESEALAVDLVMKYTVNGELAPGLSKMHVTRDWKSIIGGLLQVVPAARTKSWQHMLPTVTGWERPNNLLIHKAPWQQEVETSLLRDGSVGWPVFEM